MVREVLNSEVGTRMIAVAPNGGEVDTLVFCLSDLAAYFEENPGTLGTGTTADAACGIRKAVSHLCRPVDAVRVQLERLAEDCDGYEGLGSEVIAKRIRAISESVSTIASPDVETAADNAKAADRAALAMIGLGYAWDSVAGEWVQAGPRASSAHLQRPTVSALIAALQSLPPHFLVEFAPDGNDDVVESCAVEVLEGDTSDGPGTAWIRLVDAG